MKYIIYWELSPDKDIMDVADLVAKLSQQERYPEPPGKILGWYITSSIPMWGITLVEYDKDADSKDLFNSLLSWIKAMPGIFRVHRIAPCISVSEAVQLAHKK